MTGILAAISAGAGLQVVASPSSVSGPFGQSAPSTATVVGGLAPITYSWQNRGGDGNVYAADANLATTVFVTAGFFPTTATMVCVVTDAAGRTGESNTVSVTLT